MSFWLASTSLLDFSAGGRDRMSFAVKRAEIWTWFALFSTWNTHTHTHTEICVIEESFFSRRNHNGACTIAVLQYNTKNAMFELFPECQYMKYRRLEIEKTLLEVERSNSFSETRGSWETRNSQKVQQLEKTDKQWVQCTQMKSDINSNFIHIL
jgi:hypothetical protein